MTITTISYKKVFPISSFCTEHIGLEASLDDKENPEEALNKLKVMVDTLHAETLTQLDLYRGTKVVDVAEPVDKTIQGIIQDINACTVIDEKNGLNVQVGLMAYEGMAADYPEIKDAYDKKLKELQ